MKPANGKSAPAKGVSAKSAAPAKAAKAADAKSAASKAVAAKPVASKSAPAKPETKTESKPAAPAAKNGAKNGAVKAATVAPTAANGAAAKNGNGKKADVKVVDGKVADVKVANAKSATASAKADGPKKSDPKKPEAKKAEAKKPEAKKPEAKKPEAKKPESKVVETKKADAKKPDAASAAPVKPEPAAKSAAAKAPKAKPEPGETPIVPKKGPIDLAQHKSVAEAAAAVANARGGTGEFIIINGRRVRAISTKGITLPKKSKTTATETAAGPTEQQIREIKTKLGKKELEEYRALLHTKRRQLVGMLSGMEDEALRSSGGNLSNMPVHMADMGSDVYEQDFTLGMAETERAIINEIDAALQRIEDKTFGVCQMTGKPISKARLDAKPWAKYTIEAERIAESSGSR